MYLIYLILQFEVCCITFMRCTTICRARVQCLLPHQHGGKELPCLRLRIPMTLHQAKYYLSNFDRPHHSGKVIGSSDKPAQKKKVLYKWRFRLKGFLKKSYQKFTLLLGLVDLGYLNIAHKSCYFVFCSCQT